MRSTNNITNVFAELFSDGINIVDYTNTFTIGFDFETDVDTYGFTVNSFDLNTGLNYIDKGKDIELVIPMPIYAYDFAEKLLWRKAEKDSDFLESLMMPEMAICGRDLDDDY
jgi:hypothetical protein